jgi:hypothetical protein
MTTRTVARPGAVQTAQKSATSDRSRRRQPAAVAADEVLLGEKAFTPHPPRSGDISVAAFPWHLTTQTIRGLTG